MSTGRPLLPPAGFLPERVVNVQINVQSIDEELPISRVKTNGFTEMLKAQKVECQLSDSILHLSAGKDVHKVYRSKLKK